MIRRWTKTLELEKAESYNSVTSTNPYGKMTEANVSMTPQQRFAN